MSDDKKQKGSLTDEDMITSPKMSRRVLLATAGVALGAATLGGHAAFAEDKDAGEKDGEGGPDDKDPDDDEKDAAEKDDEGGPDDKDPDDEKDAEDQDQHDGEMDNEAERDAD